MLRTLLLRYHLFQRGSFSRQDDGLLKLKVSDFNPKLIGSLQPEDVLIRCSFAGVNAVDGLQVARGVSAPAGFEGSGAIVKCGANTPTTRLGERVAFLIRDLERRSCGAFSSFATVRTEDCIPVPPSVSDCLAAATLHDGLLACRTFELGLRQEVGKGKVAVLLGCTSGVAILLSQMLRAAECTVIGICDNAQQRNFAQQKGRFDFLCSCDGTSPQEVEFLESSLRTLLPAGVDMVFARPGDCSVTAKQLHRCVPVVRIAAVLQQESVVSSCENAWTNCVEVNLGKAFGGASDEATIERVRFLWRGIEEKMLQPVLNRIVPLRDSPKVFEELCTEPKKCSNGKTVLNCQE